MGGHIQACAVLFRPVRLIETVEQERTAWRLSELELVFFLQETRPQVSLIAELDRA